MKFLFFPLFIIIPALMLGFSMWLVVRNTKVEASFFQLFLISVIVQLTNLFPFFKEFISFAVLFLLLYKWEDIKFWPKIRFWPDSLLVLVVGWITCYASNYFAFKLTILLLKAAKNP